jgi:transposase-like protein
MTMSPPRPLPLPVQIRMEAVLAVLSGRLSVTQAARAAGVSRKTFYEWEAKAMQGLAQALTDGPPGRPPDRPDPEVARLQQEKSRLEADLEIERKTRRIREVLGEAHDPDEKKSGPRDPGP